MKDLHVLLCLLSRLYTTPCSPLIAARDPHRRTKAPSGSSADDPQAARDLQLPARAQVAAEKVEEQAGSDGQRLEEERHGCSLIPHRWLSSGIHTVHHPPRRVRCSRRKVDRGLDETKRLQLAATGHAAASVASIWLRS